MILLFYGKLVLFDHRNPFAYDRIFFYPNIIINIILRFNVSSFIICHYCITINMITIVII